MDITDKERQKLHDLALIYLALAHSTDEDLSDQEIDVIASRLREWEHVQTETVLAAIKQALEEYMRDDADKRVRNAIKQIRNSIPEEKRQDMLDDMMEIAMADGKFLHKESSFIGDLARAWGLHPDGDTPDGSLSWSLLNRDNQNGQWTPAHDLSLIYLTLAQKTDGELKSEEVETITDKLCEWLPDARREDVAELIRETMSVYVQGPDERLFNESVLAISQTIPDHQRLALLEDMKSVAEADGELHEEERRLIERLSHAWNLPEPT